MRVSDKHLYHGAVLYQIAEHPQFTAINALKIKGRPSLNAFQINDDIAVYAKIGREPTGPWSEYRFTFTQDQLAEITSIAEDGIELHLALICVKDRGICCLPYDGLQRLVDARKKLLGKREEQYVVLVMFRRGKSFRVNMNRGATKGAYVGDHILVAQNACPESLFRS